MSNENTSETTSATEKGQNVVTMADGRQVDFGKRGKQKATVDILGEGADRQVKVSVDVLNGDTHSITVGLNHPVVFELLGYGIKQKISDSTANADDPEDVSLAVQQVIDQLNEGKWSQRAGGDGMVRGMADLYEAYMTIKGLVDENGKPVDPEGKLKKRLMSQSEADIKSLRNIPQIKVKIAEIQARKAAERAAKLAGNSAAQTVDLPEIPDL